MCEYFTSDIYKNSEQLSAPYQVKGKLYTRVKRKCPKCGGSGVYKSLGTCYTCHGTGYLIEETRLFTKEEIEEYKLQKEQNAQNKAAFERTQEQEAKVKWLIRNGFTENGYTYIIMGDSYSIKERLKSLGYKYSNYIKWHAPFLYEGNSDIVTKKINVDDYYIWAPGQKAYIITTEGEEKFKKLYSAAVQSNTEWYGNIGEKFSRLKVTLTQTRAKQTDWGKTVSYFFKDEENHLLVWNTQTVPIIPQGNFYLTATIKSHYLNKKNNEKITYIQRAKIDV